MPSAIIIGARGTLGRSLSETLPNFGYDVRFGSTREECDVSKYGDVSRLVETHQPDVVFNASAYTNVDGAEDEADVAYGANALGPEHVAHACATVGAKLVHFSTDFVFDGESSRPYDEFDAISPQGVYARSKAAGEQLAQNAHAKTFVLRVGCLYGRGGRNFPSTILDRLKRGETIKADAERLGAPTWVKPVAQMAARVAQSSYFGLYHATADGETFWVDYAKFLAEQLGKRPEDLVQALPTGALPMRAPRPVRAILDNRMLRLRGFGSIGTWQEHALGFFEKRGLGAQLVAELASVQRVHQRARWNSSISVIRRRAACRPLPSRPVRSQGSGKGTCPRQSTSPEARQMSSARRLCSGCSRL